MSECQALGYFGQRLVSPRVQWILRWVYLHPCPRVAPVRRELKRLRPNSSY